MLTTAEITACARIQRRALFTLEFFFDKMWKTGYTWNKLLPTDRNVDFSTDPTYIK